ncbi:MAG: TetR/AcrR family transcriptional regulator [Firmicutes bacterium HGW-Firmicutes-12]|jgi:AcrR family transcriptional regulator|nr:MAG: TetR/AcrR family transcriptional regulator [Firmicutes bacterium HGW-Firmicutes-12]
MEKRIIEATLLLIGQYGFRKFTLDDVSSILGISKKTLYKYFPGKQHLISEALDYFIEKNKNDTLEAINEEITWVNKMKAMVNAGNAFPTRLLSELRQYYPDEWKKVELLQNFKIDQFYLLLLEGEKRGEINPAIDLKIVAPMLKEVMDSLSQMEYLTKNDLTMKQILGQLSELFFNGILIRP